MFLQKVLNQLKGPILDLHQGHFIKKLEFSLYTSVFLYGRTHLSGYWVLNEWAAFETQQACTRSFLDEMTLCHTIKALLCIHALLKKLVVLSTWYIDRMTFIALCRYQVNHIRLNTFSSKVLKHDDYGPIEFYAFPDVKLAFSNRICLLIKLVKNFVVALQNWAARRCPCLTK